MKVGEKTQEEILQKMGIAQLNAMQLEVLEAVKAHANVVVLSPTGSGKTLAFLLPIINQMNPDITGLQTLIITPTRELAIQIEQVARDMGTGYKINAAYGGRSYSKDKVELRTLPSILIGTPGRIADHIYRDTFDAEKIDFLILDEFDKSLEIGFEDEMKYILQSVDRCKRKILTSATAAIKIPEYVGLNDANAINHLDKSTLKLTYKRIISPEKDKLDTLAKALFHIGNLPGIVFCNFRESIERVSQYLTDRQINHGVFHGGMEQIDRERSLIQFRNGTHQILLATDLASRGINIPEIKYIIHYHLPSREEEFIHRNGRTARMLNDGTIYVLHWQGETLPDFINIPEVEVLMETDEVPASAWTTIFISGGRKDKISKSDIVGFFIKEGHLSQEQLGLIELKSDCAFVSVHESVADQVIDRLNNQRLKKKKLRIRLL
jgi:superfamily II DNA/RNA helicase